MKIKLHINIENLLIFPIIICFILVISINKTYAQKHDIHIDYFIAKTQLSNYKYEQALRNFHKLISTTHPKNKHAKKSKLYITLIQYKLKLSHAALNNINSYINMYKHDKYIDYAYYLRTIINYNFPYNLLYKILPIKKFKRNQTLTKQSIKDLETIIKNNYKYNNIIKNFNILKTELINHELYIANYYIKKQALIATINRMELMLNKYYYTEIYKYKILYKLIRAYNELLLPKIAKNMLLYNKPNYL